MKFVISSGLFLTHLQAINRVINSKNTMAILDNFLFNLKGNTLTMTASDSDTTMVTSVDLIEAEGDGLFAVPAKNLLDPLKELPDQPLTFEINDETLEVILYFQNGKYNFMGVNGEEYPQKKSMSETSERFSINPQVLLNGINRTVFATADDELRPVMNGIFLDIFPEEIVFVASDSHKLVRAKNTSVNAGMKASFILPKKPANLLASVLPKEDNDVEVIFDDKNAMFKLASSEITCRLIEGRFPNYASVIPTNHPNKVIIDRVLFMNVLRRVSVFSNPASSLVKLQLSENQIVVSAQDIDFSTSAIENISVSYDGTPMSIGFKATFLIEILKSISSDSVILELADSSRAGLILPEANQENEDILMLLMPMMLTDF
ncbi:MAG: DNA polymerase III subunit beta [Bacteroidales bacterium]|nr:DNA polymerase III subunit beta [Bacteroidales bacterium]